MGEEFSSNRERPDVLGGDRPDQFLSLGQSGLPEREGNDRVEADSTERLVRLLTKHQEELFRYIFGLLPNEEDAKDVLQETSVSLYCKSAEYDPDKPFLAWAYRRRRRHVGRPAGVCPDNR
jgi:hypothetical protein